MSNHGQGNRSRRMRSRTSRREPAARSVRAATSIESPTQYLHTTTTAGKHEPATRCFQHPTCTCRRSLRQPAGTEATHGVYMCWCAIRILFFSPAAEAHVDTDCGIKNEIRSREPIRCRECGHRIMYKKRTTRCTFAVCLQRPGQVTLTSLTSVVQFEAR